MASIHRQRGRPYWFCAFTEFDPQTNRAKRVFRSTKTRDRKQALEICRAWQKAALLARNGKLSVDAAREVIAQGVADVFMHANVESLPSASIKLWCETWLYAKAIEVGESTATSQSLNGSLSFLVRRKTSATFPRCRPARSRDSATRRRRSVHA